MVSSLRDRPNRNTGSKGSTSRPNKSSAPPPPAVEDVGDLVAINWSFLTKDLELDYAYPLELKQSQMKKALFYIRDVFYNEIVECYDEKAPLKASKLQFWVVRAFHFLRAYDDSHSLYSLKKRFPLRRH
jgi:hypothetical protein